ncbi:MAG: phosphoribosyl-AMP cyclohydrolase [Pseudomonadota bacterium]
MSFKPPYARKADQDETGDLRPKFNADGLIAAIAQDSETGEILMLAWMNEEALQATLDTGRATYWSRSRQALWIKGESSGHVQDVSEVLIDCDQDAVILKVRQTGGACHTGRASCFYRRIDGDGLVKLTPAPNGTEIAPSKS